MEVKDLRVYNILFRLATEVYNLAMSFPKFETYELGSQLRRSSNSAPANLAEGFSNKHTKIYTESISRAQGEIREVKHHLEMACKRNYLNEENLNYFIEEYEGCSKMLYCLEKSLEAKKAK